MLEREGIIGGHKWYAERCRPMAIQAKVMGLGCMEDLNKAFDVAQDRLTAEFRRIMNTPLHKGLAFSNPVSLGVFLFDGQNGKKMGNYGAQYDVVKDMPWEQLLSDMFAKVREGMQQGLKLQFDLFAPLHVQIGLEFAVNEAIDASDH